ncbi:hypothetical protein G9A89_019474 [Geosiphon pyriformis]|nr:hypothetical protein G9A89_019474 [Geosiphon pyriformis]
MDFNTPPLLGRTSEGSRSNQKPRIAIIGAGSSGLAAIKQCVDDQLEPVCFEQSGHIGGTWRYVEVDETNKDPHSSVYRTTVINTCKETMTFSDFPIPCDWPTFLPHNLVIKYWEMYADNFNLHQYIKLHLKVLRVFQLSNDRWMVKYASTEGDQTEQEDEFDYVMVCSGHHQKPRMPNYIGMDTFSGKQMHSHFYRESSEYLNKRVVVVGIGNSAMDISVELSHIASQVYLCSRRGHRIILLGTLPWILPRRAIFGKPLEHLIPRVMSFIPTRIRNFIFESITEIVMGRHPPGLKPQTSISSSHITVKSEFFERLMTGTIIVKPDISELKADGSINFVDGSTIQDIDAIIYTTGYFIDFPFLDREIVSGGWEIEQRFDPEYRQNLAWLYKMVFPPRYKNIAFIGLIQPDGPIFPASEMQARYFTGLINGTIPPLPDPSKMDESIQEYQNHLQKSFYNSARHTIEAAWMPYLDSLAKDIGCLPTARSVYWSFGFKAWFQHLFGVPTPIQYRLFGDHSWDGALEWIDIYNGGKSRITAPIGTIKSDPRDDVYTDGSVKNFGLPSVTGGAAVYFSDVDFGFGVSVRGIMSSTLSEIKAVSLALACAPVGSNVVVHSDSQAALSACTSELNLVVPDFRNRFWMERRHVVNIIRERSLLVSWVKVKGHAGNAGNERADELASESCFSGKTFPAVVRELCIRSAGMALSCNVRHFVRDYYRVLHRARWENGSGSSVLKDLDVWEVDWKSTAEVWHPDAHMASGFTSRSTAGLHKRLPVAVRKRLYDASYPSVSCVFCGEMETSDHVFGCVMDRNCREEILAEFHRQWASLVGVDISSSGILRDLEFCLVDVDRYTSLVKGFVPKGWSREAKLVFGDSGRAGAYVVSFVRNLVSAHRSRVWCRRSEHVAVLVRNGLLALDNCVVPRVGVSMGRFVDGTVVLLSVEENRGVHFGSRLRCLFCSGLGGDVEVLVDM